MTPTLEQINVALAKWAGWTCINTDYLVGLPPDKKVSDYTTKQVLEGDVSLWKIPVYTTSLDAIHRDLESRLTDEQWDEYLAALDEVTGNNQWIRNFVHATAEQKARALFTALQLEVI
jgi:hypothetical protein